MPAAAKVYTLEVGRDYNPYTNGNKVVKFRATSTAGSTVLTGVGASVTDWVFTVINSYPGVAVVSGPGVNGGSTRYDLIDMSYIVPGELSLTNPLTLTGTYEFTLWDASVPSAEDAPITSFHVIDKGAGTFDFVTFQGNSISIANSGMVNGAIYPYIIGLVNGLPNGTGSILGLANNSKPLFID